jgi:polysaccharide export outer membrane protein
MRKEVKMLGAKSRRLGFGATALLCAALCSGVLSAQAPQYRVEGPKSFYTYHIYPGDILQISVYQHPELSKTVVVRPNGDINVPRLNAVRVAGLSVELASDLVRQKLQSVIDQPCMTITVKRRNGAWILEKEPFFIDVPSPGFSQTQIHDS